MRQKKSEKITKKHKTFERCTPVLLKEDNQKNNRKDNIFEKSPKKAEIPVRNLSSYNHTQLLKPGLSQVQNRLSHICQEKKD